MRRIMKAIMKAIGSAVAIFLACSGLAFGQVGGYPPGVNPSNPNDVSHLGNRNDMTLPGASNPHDLVRFPPSQQLLSPGLPRAIPPAPPVSSTLAHTHIDQPVKKLARHKRHPAEPRSQ
jgi:hypothetical protein